MNLSGITILLVDDHAVVREGYRRLLERHGDIAVIGEAQDAASAIRVEYAVSKPQVDLEQGTVSPGKPAAQYSRGDAESAFQQAAVKIDSQN